MGRKKSRPIRSGGILANTDVPSSSSPKHIIQNNGSKEAHEVTDFSKPYYVDVDRSSWDSDEHYDLAEIILDNVKFSDELLDDILIADSLSRSLRFRLHGVEDSSFRLGHWPILSADDINLEYIDLEYSITDHHKEARVLCTGTFDGTEESVSGLVHLVNLKYVTLRPILEARFWINSSFKVRVEILPGAFNACGSLLEYARQPWRRSMMNIMSWMRPEAVTSEAIYAISLSGIEQSAGIELERTVSPTKHTSFNVAAFYEAIKPSKNEPVLDDDLHNLVPQLRPYQRRAAYWMVQREKGLSQSSGEILENQLCHPLCVSVNLLESHSRLFYNPFNGNVSLRPDVSSSYVFGGILADEMGLGKTVELLACIYAHQRSSIEGEVASHADEEYEMQIKRQKRERVECICGAASESSSYKGLWVQCDVCDSWQHAECVGYKPKKKSLVTSVVDRRRASHEDSVIKSKNHKRKRETSKIVEVVGSFVCSTCSDLTEAATSTIFTGATLIVCPAPILAQWHSEIVRHTKPGSLRICIYEGARNLDFPATFRSDMGEIANADIVLTTYDILKEDLSHDSDRHDGDRHFLRFQKRYPVVPTLLTRMYWWRLCLDEAQMVECNTASVTEMAMRLRARYRWCITGTPIQRRLDDLYGLVRFLRASPFDAYRLWVDVIRDPYERGDVVAMQFTHSFFRRIMWRSAKAHVSDELDLPPQEECVSWLTFSQIEEHFYHRQHETCARYAHEIIKNFRDEQHMKYSFSGYNASPAGILSHNDVSKLLHPLLKLRQACCHPQVGSSGLCSLQQSPLTMGEILKVLIGKTKTEGEEALRRIVVALNGLSAIAVIEEDYEKALCLYKEALALADEVSADFRLDPLLSLHVHHNLAEILPATSQYTKHCPFVGREAIENKNHVDRRKLGGGGHDCCNLEKEKVSGEKKLIPEGSSTSLDVSITANAVNDDFVHTHCGSHCKASFRCYSEECLRKECEILKRKFMSLFISKLSSARNEFESTHMQVCTLMKEFQDQSMIWWLHALDLIGKNKDSFDELLSRVDQAVSKATNSSKPLKIASRFRDVSGLKYTIQKGLDSLEASRQELIERLLAIDQTIERARDEDIELWRYCPNCNGGNGSLCIHCKLYDLFKVYGARLFLLKKGINGSSIASVEEALDMQNQISELNRFFREKKASLDSADDGKSTQRHATAKLQVSRNPSELEIILGVLRTYSKTRLGRQGLASARQHLLHFEVMRKEYAHANSLSLAQAQLLRAHDEVKMAISRLRLKVTEDEPTSNDVLSKEELIPSSVQFSSDKFLALSSLGTIKGQLRYLKGLAESKERSEEQSDNLPSSQDKTKLETSLRTKEEERLLKTDDALCPICHENLDNQRMVFQCGHIICCKCCLQMSESASKLNTGKSPKKWIMCPICRQHTHIENIAYAVENPFQTSDNIRPKAPQAQNKSEISIIVQGSYGTKIEAITRRILWINSTNEEEKVIVFSSWNDVLDVLAHALNANGISFVRMKGGRKSQVALAQFKGNASGPGGHKKDEQASRSGSVQVLLMLVQHGANGLNILEAQHVILVEPLLNPADEAQAINRVHRIGQQKMTFVHRFIVKSTVEESIYKLNRSRAQNPIVNIKPKHQDQPDLTLQDVESLFSSSAPAELNEDELPTGSLRHLPPGLAAGLAAERRMLASSNSNHP